MNPTVQPGQVWEHRTDCRLCSKHGSHKTAHRHRYVVLEVLDERVRVRDLIININRPDGSPYTRPLAVFGSLDKGGLRHCGHLTRNHFEPVPAGQLDDRVLQHIRVPLRNIPKWTPIPGTAGAAREAFAA